MTDTFDPAATLEALREEAAARDTALQNIVTTYSEVHAAQRALEDAVTAHQTARKDGEPFGITDALLKRANIEPIGSPSRTSSKPSSKSRSKRGTAQPKAIAAAPATAAPAPSQDAPAHEEQRAS
ncbi:hypothetical protein AXK56_16495 [Tsukamurella pulmonis]|uniref:Uncharacterized protein n=1 Tax=Tsukamurella pulmonis TaxID=47312 RepID=A0A1H1A8S4_9ACTN|nr:hypothetical protein [Tsukamurella pulmonis]KXO95810.1 hypothetical protein AXK56_16495 [Tsukamurella pulmonis]SDQ36125.1 hypothetical protein SAMN04489765_0110 [Tsukamurella pulmonis]SUQ39427.1 Uncharacterised protein [Tsukamurella pulmonis]